MSVETRRRGFSNSNCGGCLELCIEAFVSLCKSFLDTGSSFLLYDLVLFIFFELSFRRDDHLQSMASAKVYLAIHCRTSQQSLWQLAYSIEKTVH